MPAIGTQRLRTAAGIVALLALVVAGDLSVGYDYQFFIFYFLPIALAAWHLGRAAGLVTTALCAAACVIADLRSGPSHADIASLYWNWGIRLVAFIVIALTLARLHRTLSEERRLRSEVEHALHEVKRLRGLLPICSSCKRIRNDEGSWEQIELYVREHSDAEFTHGLCPECMRKLYPEVADRVLNRPDARP